MTPPKIRAIQVRDYRCLRHVDVRLDHGFYVAVGTNGSGKSTLFDVIEFVFDLFRNGLHETIKTRTSNFQDLVWGRPKENGRFELATEFDVDGVPFRYEVKIGEVGDCGAQIIGEAGYIGCLSDAAFAGRAGFDSVFCADEDDLVPVFKRDSDEDGEWATFHSENPADAVMMQSMSNDTSAMQYIALVDRFRPSDKGKRPIDMTVATGVAASLLERRTVQFLQLDSRALRRPAPWNGDDGNRLAKDGSNLPRVIKSLAQDNALWQRWIAHVREALPGIRGIRSVHREEDRSDYLMIRYASGVEVPAWGVSEGTLRILALTVLAYLPNEQPAAYLIEEPENGIHPMAIEIAYQSLSSVYESQVFIASHSPTFLRCVEPCEVLCFAHNEDNGTVIISGEHHPKLSEWRGSLDDDVFFAADILR